MPEPTAYESVAASLRKAIARGDYAGGRRMPTEAELSAAHGVSRQTVRRAIADLVDEGLVYRVRGRGTFTTTFSPGSQYLRSIGSIDELLSLAADTVRETIRPLELRADVNAASRLQLDTDQVMTAMFRRSHEQIPFVIVEVFVPPAIGRRLLARGALARAGETDSRTTVGIVDELIPDGVSGAHQSITAVALPDELGGWLDLPAGAPALRIDRVYVDVRGEPIYLAVSHFDPGRYTYRVQLRRRGRA